jgi:hypothetical protein
MALFVHLALASRMAHIRRTGIRQLRPAGRTFLGGVFAVPLMPDFTLSHQWLRELKRRNQGPIAAVSFRLPKEQPVWVGH